MPETEPRTPDPQGQDRPRVTASAIPGDEPADPPAGAPDAAGLVARAVGPASASQEESAGALRADRTDRDQSDRDRSDRDPSDRDRAAGPAHADASSRRARKAKAREGHSPLFLWLKEVATVVIVAIVLSFLINTFLFRAF